jgi:KUP system potassium uptake protein
MTSAHIKKLSAAGALVTLGIIFGDIGTSPLYVLKSIVGDRDITEELIFGGVSCIFWTLTIQTTFKYMVLTLEADNYGEGGIFALYTLVRHYGKQLYLPAMIGAGTMLADGIITPPISVSSAVEGLRGIDPAIPVMPIVLIILTLLFFFQRFGTNVIGKSFGPIMLIWFVMIGVFGVHGLVAYPSVLKAINPVYAVRLLTAYPSGFWLLGAVFLATTGAEALYADLGHCGKQNIRATWIFVKTSLLLNYFGQAAWLLARGEPKLGPANPFYEMMPHAFLPAGILIATAATIIASQALISGSFTLINEALTLNFWPRVTVVYPTEISGQIYIPSLNRVLWAGCVATVLYFKESSQMEAAYGFSIVIAMMMTTFLMSYYLHYRRKLALGLVIAILLLLSLVEVSFFIANAAKIKQRWMFLVFEFGIIFTMFTWYHARRITSRLLKYVKLREHIPLLMDLSGDETIPMFATNLVYLTKAGDPESVEEKIIYSIFSHQPKRAEIYWFVHIERADEPYTMQYRVEELENDKVIRVWFKLGFRVHASMHVLFKKVVDEMVAGNELNVTSRYPSLKKYNIATDFRFVVLEKFLSHENEFRFRDGFILHSYFALKRLAESEEETFGLDTSETHIEKIPLVVSPAPHIRLKRVE